MITPIKGKSNWRERGEAWPSGLSAHTEKISPEIECCYCPALVCRRWEVLLAPPALLLHRRKATTGQFTAGRGKHGAVSPQGRATGGEGQGYFHEGHLRGNTEPSELNVTLPNDTLLLANKPSCTENTLVNAINKCCFIKLSRKRSCLVN